MKKKVNYKYLNVLLLLGIIYLLFLMKGVWLGAASKIISIILPFVIAFAISYVLYPFLKYLINKKIPKILGVLIIFAVILLAIGLIIYYVIPLFFNQLINLLSNLVKVSTDIATKFGVNTDAINDAISSFSDELIKQIGNFIANGSFVGLLNKSVNIVSNVVIGFIASIYFLIDMPKIRSKIKKYLLKTNRKKYNLVLNIDHEITSYLKGLGIIMIIQFFEYTFLFYIIGHPNFLLIGVLASITTIIPYFGGFITNVFALVIASVISSKLFMLTLIITLVFPNVDGYLISPKVYDKTNQLPPLLTIFVVFAGGVLFGFLGIVVAVPVTIIIVSIIKSYKGEIFGKIKRVKDKI